MTQTTGLLSITHDGQKIAYLEAGAGDPAIVFVHGWSCDHSFWSDQVAHFAPSHRVVAVDLLGHGTSDKPQRDYTIDGFVEVVASLIAELGLDRPVVVGHSMGGVIAMALARKHPDLVRGIVPVDAPAVPFPDERRPLIDAVVATMATPAYVDTATVFVRGMFRADSDPALVESVLERITATPQHVMHSALANTLDATSSPGGALPVPTLFLRAETAYFTEDDLRQRYPGIEVKTIDVGHFIQMERPTETNAAIDKFIGDIA